MDTKEGFVPSESLHCIWMVFRRYTNYNCLYVCENFLSNDDFFKEQLVAVGQQLLVYVNTMSINGRFQASERTQKDHKIMW